MSPGRQGMKLAKHRIYLTGEMLSELKELIMVSLQDRYLRVKEAQNLGDESLLAVCRMELEKLVLLQEAIINATGVPIEEIAAVMLGIEEDEEETAEPQ